MPPEADVTKVILHWDDGTDPRRNQPVTVQDRCEWDGPWREECSEGVPGAEQRTEERRPRGGAALRRWEHGICGTSCSALHGLGTGFEESRGAAEAGREAAEWVPGRTGGPLGGEELPGPLAVSRTRRSYKA